MINCVIGGALLLWAIWGIRRIIRRKGSCCGGNCAHCSQCVHPESHEKTL
ncbi:MAG: FeoB-associated Cys-rich membrane protein [Eubacteriales bacterium]|jgi:hypothetical protein